MNLRQVYTEKVIEEIHRRGEAEASPPVDTVFFGGGTPSLLMPKQLEGILDAVHASFSVSSEAEVTLEANPGTLTDAFLDTAQAKGVNRLSLGAQSSDEHLLKILGRRHLWHHVQESVKRIVHHGITNINVDLMFGLPGQTMQQWEETLDAALDLPLTHLSCYGLIVEDGTPLKETLATGSLSLPSVELERRMYDRAIERLALHGFSQYEISNFSKPGFECKHNIGCWTRIPYIGFGCAAHSLLSAGLRHQNPEDLQEYLSGMVGEETELSLKDQMFETVMLGLRQTRGIDEKAFTKQFGVGFRTAYAKQIKVNCQKGLTCLTDDGFFRLNRQGMDLMNSVLLDFMDDIG